VDIDFVAAIGGLVEVDVGALRGAFGGAFGGRLVDEMLGGLVTDDVGVLGGVFGDRLVGVVVSVLRVLFLRVDFEIVGAACVPKD
jgi:hypothetical protein